MHGIRIKDLLLHLGIITSVLSFCSYNAIASFCSIAMYVIWGLYAITLFSRRVILKKKVLFMLIAFAVMWMAGQLFYRLGYYRSSGPGPAGMLVYCAIFYFIGCNLDFSDSKLITKMAVVYAFAQILFIILGIGSATIAKNQTGQVIGAGIVIELFFLPKVLKNRLARYLSISLGIAALAYLFYLHCRTPFLGIIMLLMYVMIRKRSSLASFIITAVVVLSLFIFSNTSVGSSLMYNFLQGDFSYSALSLTSMSSGRITYYQEAIHGFSSSPIIGVGAWAYVDSFPFHVLRTGGLLAAAILFPIAYGTLFQCTFIAGKRDMNGILPNRFLYESTYISFLLSFYYIVISLFEGYPPLGPNASVFFLWIVIGNSQSKEQRFIENET